LTGSKKLSNEHHHLFLRGKIFAPEYLLPAAHRLRFLDHLSSPESYDYATCNLGEVVSIQTSITISPSSIFKLELEVRVPIISIPKAFGPRFQHCTVSILPGILSGITVKSSHLPQTHLDMFPSNSRSVAQSQTLGYADGVLDLPAVELRKGKPVQTLIVHPIGPDT
jgi:hypothetical protein